MAQFVSAPGHRKRAIKERTGLPPRHHSGESLATARTLCGSITCYSKTQFGSVPSHCRCANRQHFWPHNCKFWTIISSRRRAVRNQHNAQPGRHAGWQLATTKTKFGNILGHSEGIIREHHSQPPMQYSGLFLAIAKAQFRSAICNNQRIRRMYVWQQRRCFSGSSIRERSGNSQGILRECNLL